MSGTPATITPRLESRPHRVAFADPGEGCGLWAMRAFVLPLLCIGFVAIAYLVVVLAWAAFGQDQSAAVSNVRARREHGGGLTFLAKVDYVARGELRTKEVQISQDSYQRLAAQPEPQRAVTVRVLRVGPWSYAEHPDRHHTVGHPFVAALAALIWNGAVLSFAHQYYVRPWQVRRLYRWGLPARGQITTKESINNKSW